MTRFEKMAGYPDEIRGRFNSFIATQFDDSLSVEMQLRSIIKWAIDNFKEMEKTYNDFTEYVVQGNLNPFIQFLNDLIDYMNEFVDTFDTKLQDEILLNLQKWNDDGTLETLVNESLDTKYHEMDQRLTTQLAQKVGGGKLATLNDFDEETLNFIHDGTGGPIQIESVPKDKSVTPDKTTFFEQERINLFDKTTITTPGIVTIGTGEIATIGEVARLFAASDYIPVIENQTYEISYSGSQASFAWYSDTSIDSYMSSDYVTHTRKKHESPVGAKYLRVTFNLDFIDSAMVAKDVLPSNYVAYNDVELNFQTPNQRKSIAQEILTEIESRTNVKSESAKRFEDKLWSVVGDSITEKNFRATTHYHDHVSSWLGMTVDNQGYSGTGYLQTYNTSLKIPDRLDLVNPNADLITVFAGVNDSGRPLGEFGDTDKDVTLYGAIDYTLRTLIEKFPTKKIAVFTPTPASTRWGINNNSLQLLADAVIKTANHYSIPCLDLYRESGLRPWNADNNKEFFSVTSVPNGDGLHMNDKGQLWIAYKIYEFLLTL